MLTTFYTDGKGLTLTSAQHLANLARETAKRIEEKLSAASFVREEWCVLGSDNWLQTNLGCDQSVLDSYIADLERVSQMYSWVAWVGEAITTREAAIDQIRSKSLEDYCKERGIELPTCEFIDNVTEADAIDDLSTKERAEYLTREAFAATYGKFIHDKMPFNVARKALANAIAQPYEPRGEGQNCVVVRKSPSVSSEKVEECFNALQANYRENERSLNAIKTVLKHKVADDNMKNRREMTARHEACTSARQKYEIEFGNWADAEILRISKMKVIVPLSLQPIVDELNSLSEKK